LILIADSGSTKTEWSLCNEITLLQQFQTTGLNPFFSDEHYIADVIQKNIVSSLDINSITSVHFYGAGCLFEEQKNIVKKACTSLFKKAAHTVESDLLGAARALCGQEAGIACILGTGSNSCFYDGKNIVKNISSLGYILGDEGSGAHIGKMFIRAYLRKDLPEEIQAAFFDKCKLSDEEIMHKVYHELNPNRFLSSCTRFMVNYLQNDFISNLIKKSFSESFTNHICKYPQHEKHLVHFTGSVAFIFKDLLSQIAAQHKVRIGNITRSPMEGLIKFHTQLKKA